MKKLLVILLAMTIVVSVSAQRKYGGGRYYQPRTRIVVGYGGYYPYYPLSPYDYYWGSPYGYNRPSRLQLKIEDIRNDYKTGSGPPGMIKAFLGQPEKRDTSAKI